MNKYDSQLLLVNSGMNAISRTQTAGYIPDVVTVACIRTVEALEQLAGDWREMFQKIGCRNPFLSVEWVKSWWRHWGGHDQLFIIAVRNGQGRLVAVAPFYFRRSHLGERESRALCLIGTHKLAASFHLDILMDPVYESLAIGTIASLVEQHHTEWDYVELFPTDRNSPAVTGLCYRLGLIGMTEKVIQTKTTLCPYIDLPPSFEDYLENVGANLRYNFRRRWRALEREGVEFVAFRGSSELHKKFDELIRLHRLRFDAKQEHSTFISPVGIKFHVDALASLAEARMASLFLLQVRGKAIAALYGFSTGKTFSFYQAGMDPAWSRHSVGLVMMGCSIREAIHSGHDKFDFLGGPNPYKLKWTNKVREDVMICLFNRSARSRLAWLRIKLIDHLRKLKRRYFFPDGWIDPAGIRKISGEMIHTDPTTK